MAGDRETEAVGWGHLFLRDEPAVLGSATSPSELRFCPGILEVTTGQRGRWGLPALLSLLLTFSASASQPEAFTLRSPKAKAVASVCWTLSRAEKPLLVQSLLRGVHNLKQLPSQSKTSLSCPGAPGFAGPLELIQPRRLSLRCKGNGRLLCPASLGHLVP